MMIGLHDAAQSGWFDIDRQELFEGFRVTAEDVVLDVGCGAGSYSALCGGWGAHVIFTDMNPDNVAGTRQRLLQTAARGVTPIVADTTALPLDDASVSRIVSTEMIEHVANPATLLRELARVGKPGALYLLSVPDPVHEGLQRQLAPASYFQKREPGVGKIRGLWGGAQHTIEREEFEHLVTDAGLVVEQHRYSGFFWALWFTFFWGCDVDFPGTGHPVLEGWTRTWKMVLDHPDGRRVKDRLDAFMPKSQIIIARKPS
jgi:ubiquinone/menaquinone biosynthesis C-methylase UbiE